VDRSLGVERVEHRLDEHDLGSAGDQSLDLFDIDVGQEVEIDLAKARVVDVGRERQRLVGRPERAGDEASTMIRAAALLMSRTRCSAP
jgi:hypothetical protein